MQNQKLRCMDIYITTLPKILLLLMILVSDNNLTLSDNEMLFITEFICYDDACHLKHFSTNSNRADLTDQTRILAAKKMVVDKMHMRGHVDAWCKENCDARKFTQLDKVKKYFICPSHIL